MDFMKIAIAQAYKGIRKKQGGPFGAVIVKKGKIIAQAHNTVLLTNDPTAHAEINAIRKASRKLKKFDLSDCEIYSNCEPCPMCFSAIHWAQIKTIYYGATLKDSTKAGFNELAITDEQLKKMSKSKVRLVKNVSKEESTAPFKEYAKNRGKKY